MSGSGKGGTAVSPGLAGGPIHSAAHRPHGSTAAGRLLVKRAGSHQTDRHRGEGHGDGLIRTALDLQRQGRLPVERLTERFPLADIDEAVRPAHTAAVAKPVISMARGASS